MLICGSATLRVTCHVSASSRDAVNFPIRLLELANRCQPEADIPSFSKLARMVGQMKEPYNDKM